MKTIIRILLAACILLTISGVADAATSTTKPKQGPLPQQIASTGSKTFIFSPRVHQWAVYDGSGKKVRSGVGNGGANYCRDIKRGCHTPTGNFSIIAKRGASCKSSLYPIKKGKRGGAHMPYCSFFSKNYAIHGYAHLTNANVSHGCIRVHTGDAAWIQSYLPMGSRVIVKSY
jgi:lipoprotein-anchoring transpeptidase ErfK/SrfK